MFQWLSIGTGYGDAEHKILKYLRHNSAQNIGLLECYEPGNEQFQHLQKVDFGRGVKVRTHNEAFGPKTKLPEKGYDIITMFHVHYYWISAKERSAIMDKLFKLLIPGGKLYILMLDKVHIILVDKSSREKIFREQNLVKKIS